ncbi:MoaD/ThiS family protein [Deltaproteobacteria bacterium TL4]
MSVVVEIPSALQKYAGDNDEVSVEANTVKGAFNALCEQYKDLKQHLYDDRGTIRSFINVYVNDEDIRYVNNLATELQDGDCVQIVPSIAGGY